MGNALDLSADVGSVYEWIISLAVVGIVGAAGVLGEVMRRRDLRQERQSQEDLPVH